MEGERDTERGLNCIFIFNQPVFCSSTPFPPPSFILMWFLLHCSDRKNPFPHVSFFLSDTCFFFLLKLLLNLLFNSLLSLQVWLKKTSITGSPTQSIRTPAQIFFHTPVFDTYVKVIMLRSRCFACCVKQNPVWMRRNIKQQAATFYEMLFAHTDVLSCLSWENAAACSHFHTSGRLLLTQQLPVTHFPLVVWPLK